MPYHAVRCHGVWVPYCLLLLVECVFVHIWTWKLIHMLCIDWRGTTCSPVKYAIVEHKTIFSPVIFSGTQINHFDSWREREWWLEVKSVHSLYPCNGLLKKITNTHTHTHSTHPVQAYTLYRHTHEFLTASSVRLCCFSVCVFVWGMT